MAMISGFLRDEGLLARAMRSSVWTIFGFGASQIVRLASNLILTRLLFPEAFGMMALVTVAIVGLANFSDLGTAPAIAYNCRGDDPDFLDTAWTLHVLRGFLLWLATCALALPLASFYNEPMLAQLLPVAGLSLVIGGLNPTRIETAQRHLNLGRTIRLDLASQIIGTLAMVALAVASKSIWALVVGGLVGSFAKLALSHALLPGHANRFRWEAEASHELVHFGKWIFLSTVCGFMVAQGDRVVLGKYLSIDMLGIYNIGYFLASFPILLGGAVIGKVLIPLYRDRPPSASAENYRKLRLMRFGMTGGIVGLLIAMTNAGIPLVGVLYDARFQMAGPIVVLMACVQIPHAIVFTYDQAALAVGDSRRFFFLMAPRAIVLTLLLLTGAHVAGLVGALIGQAVASIMVYPLVVRLARRYGAWDPLHDALFGTLGLMLGGLSLWRNWDAVAALAHSG